MNHKFDCSRRARFGRRFGYLMLLSLCLPLASCGVFLDLGFACLHSSDECRRPDIAVDIGYWHPSPRHGVRRCR